MEKNPNIVKEAAKGALRGAASGGGLVGSIAGGVQAGIGGVNRVRSSFQSFRKKQAQSAPKPKFVKKQPTAPKPNKPVTPKPPVKK